MNLGLSEGWHRQRVAGVRSTRGEAPGATGMIPGITEGVAQATCCLSPKDKRESSDRWEGIMIPNVEFSGEAKRNPL